MKILFLAFVLCVADGQAIVKSVRQTNEIANEKPISGAEMIFFVIRTLENLKSLLEANEWVNIYAYPAMSLQLPNVQDNQNQDQDKNGYWTEENIKNYLNKVQSTLARNRNGARYGRLAHQRRSYIGLTHPWFVIPKPSRPPTLSASRPSMPIPPQSSRFLSDITPVGPGYLFRQQPPHRPKPPGNS